MKKLFLLVLIAPYFSLFCFEKENSLVTHPPSTNPTYLVTDKEFKEFQAFKSYQEQQALQKEEARQRKAHPPHRTSGMTQSFLTDTTPLALAPKGHSRQRSASDGELARVMKATAQEQEPLEELPPEYALINTETVDNILKYGDTELTKALKAFTELTHTLRKNLTEATELYKEQTQTTLAPHAPSKGSKLKTVLRVIRGRSKEYDAEAELRKQIHTNTKTTEEAKKALVPLLVGIGVTAREVAKLGTKVEAANERVKKEQQKLNERRVSTSSGWWSPIRSRRIAPTTSSEASTFSRSTQKDADA